VARFDATERALESDGDAALAAFAGLPNISIDFSVLEHATNRVVVEADLGWADIGDWSAVHAASAVKDDDNNVRPESSIVFDSQGSYFSTSPAKLIAAIGVSDLVVIDTDDALLICPRHRTQEVRRIVDEARRRGFDRYL
jgi:mannose-1-phosphate guanylyltransferase